MIVIESLLVLIKFNVLFMAMNSSSRIRFGMKFFFIYFLYDNLFWVLM